MPVVLVWEKKSWAEEKPKQINTESSEWCKLTHVYTLILASWSKLCTLWSDVVSALEKSFEQNFVAIFLTWRKTMDCLFFGDERQSSSFVPNMHYYNHYDFKGGCNWKRVNLHKFIRSVAAGCSQEKGLFVKAERHLFISDIYSALSVILRVGSEGVEALTINKSTLRPVFTVVCNALRKLTNVKKHTQKHCLFYPW